MGVKLLFGHEQQKSLQKTSNHRDLLVPVLSLLSGWSIFSYLSAFVVDGWTGLIHPQGLGSFEWLLGIQAYIKCCYLLSRLGATKSEGLTMKTTGSGASGSVNELSTIQA